MVVDQVRVAGLQGGVSWTGTGHLRTGLSGSSGSMAIEGLRGTQLEAGPPSDAGGTGVSPFACSLEDSALSLLSSPPALSGRATPLFLAPVTRWSPCELQNTSAWPCMFRTHMCMYVSMSGRPHVSCDEHVYVCMCQSATDPLSPSNRAGPWLKCQWSLQSPPDPGDSAPRELARWSHGALHCTPRPLGHLTSSL